MIISLIKKKVLSPSRVNGHYLVAVDATHVQNVKKKSEGATTQTSSGGCITTKRSVLEMQVIAWGMALSIGSEWIANDLKTAEEKQDCEINAFKRLCTKIKASFPRLPILIVADGLYASAPFFSLCAENKWNYFVVLKDKKLSTVWDSVFDALENFFEDNMNMIMEEKIEGIKTVDQVIEWVNGIKYKGHNLSWVEQKFGGSQFVHLSSLAIVHANVRQLCDAGRRRWLIEDSFNTQKNRGIGLGHQFSRSSWQATQNYYQALQIGRILAQLIEHSNLFKKCKTAKESIKAMWRLALNAMIFLSDIAFVKQSKRLRISYTY